MYIQSMCIYVYVYELHTELQSMLRWSDAGYCIQTSRLPEIQVRTAENLVV